MPAAKCTPTKRTKKLSKRKRAKLTPSKYAIPERRAYPIPDAYHATLALQSLIRVAGRHGPRKTDARRVISAVKKRWPDVYICEFDLVCEAAERNHLPRPRTPPELRG